MSSAGCVRLTPQLLRPLLVFLGALALGTAGCGGDDKSAAPSKTEYITKADAICAPFNKEAARLSARLERISGTSYEATLSRYVPVLKEGLRLNRDYVGRLAALEPPQEEEQAVKRFIGWELETNGLVARLVDAAERRDKRAFDKTAAENNQLLRKIKEFAQGFGFKQCKQ
jgi:hypothetical protein